MLLRHLRAEKLGWKQIAESVTAYKTCSGCYLSKAKNDFLPCQWARTDALLHCRVCVAEKQNSDEERSMSTFVSLAARRNGDAYIARIGNRRTSTAIGQGQGRVCATPKLLSVNRACNNPRETNKWSQVKRICICRSAKVDFEQISYTSVTSNSQRKT